MFKRKKSLNFYGLLIQQVTVIRDAVEAYAASVRTPPRKTVTL